MSDLQTQQVEERLGLTPPAAGAEGDRVRLPDSTPDLPPWIPIRIDRTPDTTPPSIHVYVGRTDEEGGVVLRVDLYELPSAGDAHDHLLRMLCEFQSPRLRVLDDVGIGDVAIGHDETAIAVRHANIVFLVRNAGREVVPVLDLARTVDETLR